jgi:DNA invertase Pin-like site-specific DNA recombinase
MSPSYVRSRRALIPECQREGITAAKQRGAYTGRKARWHSSCPSATGLAAVLIISHGRHFRE